MYKHLEYLYNWLDTLRTVVSVIFCRCRSVEIDSEVEDAIHRTLYSAYCPHCGRTRRVVHMKM